MDSPKVAQQIETPRSPDPIMRRPGADREEKRVTHGATSSGERQEKLDLTDPNQRLLAQRSYKEHLVYAQVAPGAIGSLSRSK